MDLSSGCASVSGAPRKTRGACVLGLFLAGLALSTVVAGVSLLGPGAAYRHDERGSPVATLRFWTLLLFGSGVVGAALCLAGAWGPVAFAVALAVGGVGARLAYPLLDDSSADTGLEGLAGATGRVVLPIGPGGGRVTVQTPHGCLELRAHADDGRVIERGTAVLVARVEGGEACVWDPLAPPRPRRSEGPAEPLGDQPALVCDDFAEQDGGHWPTTERSPFPG